MTEESKTWQERLIEAFEDDPGNPQYLGECEVFAVQSGSDPNAAYYVMFVPGQGFVCTCKGFRYKNKCRHRIEVGAGLTQG